MEESYTGFTDIPEEMNPNDIHDTMNFPRDSFVDHNSNKYFNNINNSNQPFQKQQKHFPMENNDNNSSSDEDENESGYSINFLNGLDMYKQIPSNYQKTKRINNSYNNNNNFNYYSDSMYKNVSRNPNQNINNYNNNNANNYQQQNYNNNYNQIYNPSSNIPLQMPQNDEIEEEEQELYEGQYQEQEQEQEKEEYNEEENYNNDNNSININSNYEENQNRNENYNNQNPNIDTQQIETPSYDKKKLEKLLSFCRKKGVPIIDPENFSYDNWKVFYPETEKFFLWKKGTVIPNQVLIKNENDPENLEIYEGEINNKKEKHGKGIMTTPKYARIGTWRDDEFTGWGRELRINGDVFEGRFVDGAIFGKGVNKNKDGNCYIGDFVDSKREGKGKLTTAKIEYEGEFKYGKFNGNGKIKFVKLGHEYEGEFKNNEINGSGIFKWSNGETYEGEMMNGKMNGYGKYTYSNGQIYEGNYVNGVKEGLGKLTSPNQSIYEGEFKKGIPDGEGVLFIKGKKLNVIYKDGKFRKKTK